MATRVEDLAATFTHNSETDALLRHLPVGAIIAEAPSGRFITVNAHAQDLWGGALPVPESAGEYSRSFTGLRPNGREYARDEWPIMRAMHGEVVAEEEIEFCLPGGTRRTMLVSAAPVRDEAGDIIRVLCLFSDITEERAEERRREFLMTLSNDLRLLDDADAITETAVVVTGEHLGVASVSYAGVDPATHSAVVHAEYRNGRVAATGRYYLDEFGAELVSRVEQGQTVAVEDIASDPLVDAEVFDQWGIRSLLCVPIVRRGHLVSILTLMHSAPRKWTRGDISLAQQVAEWTWQSAGAARVQAELRQSREWLSLALRAGSAAIWEWDLRSGEIHWSEEHDSLLDVPDARRTLTFSRWLALVHSEDRADVRRAARRIAAMREGEIELEHRVAGDQPRWLTMRGRVIADARGLPQRVVGVAVDSTVSRLEAMQREEALQQVREASEAKSHFIGVLSHEFRTPLTAIIGYTDLLATGVSGALAPAQERQLDRIRASAWHLTQMVDEILTFSRIEAGREGLTLDATDVVSVAREARSLVAPTAATKGLGLVGELPDEAIMVQTDSGKLRQILLNLLGNAIKFTEKGGITLRVLADDDRVTFEVRDTGVGISAEHVERIFERFWQANQEGARPISGAGLGLTVSRHLVQLLGGDISVESEPNSGSTFRFHIPRG